MTNEQARKRVAKFVAEYRKMRGRDQELLIGLNTGVEGREAELLLADLDTLTAPAIADCARQAPAPVEVSITMEECIQSIIRDLSELPDYTSPDEWPHALLASPDELRVVLERHLALMASTPVGEVPAGWRDVMAERQRQVSAEGWTTAHDDEHTGGDLAAAAESYCAAASVVLTTGQPWPYYSTPTHWPWESDAFKPGPARRMLVKAGALILAEIERIDRSTLRDGPTAPVVSARESWKAFVRSDVSPPEKTASDEFVGARLRHVCELAGVPVPDGDDKFLASVAFTLLGSIRRNLQAKQWPQDVSDPMVMAACDAGGWRITEQSVKDVSAALRAALLVGFDPAAPQLWKTVAAPTAASAQAVQAAAPSEPEAQKAVADSPDMTTHAALSRLVKNLREGDWNLRAPQELADLVADGIAAAIRIDQFATPSPAASMEDAATLCEGLAEMMEQGAGEVQPGQRLRQAARGIRALAAKNGWRLGEGRG